MRKLIGLFSLLAVLATAFVQPAHAALGYSSTLKNAQLDAIGTATGSAGTITFYSGTKPAVCGTETTVLAVLTGSSPFWGSASGGTLTASAISSDTDADATGTAQWFRLKTSGGTCVMDGTVTATGGGGDITLSSTSIAQHQTVSLTSAVITNGN